VLDDNVPKPTQIAHQGVWVNVSNPLTVKFLTGVAILMAVTSVALSAMWQPLLNYVSFLILTCMGGIFYHIAMQVQKKNTIAGGSCPLKITPHHIFVHNQIGQTVPFTIQSVWWHAGGITVIICSNCPDTSQRKKGTFSIWKSQNSAQNYRWASICISNQINVAREAKVASSCLT
jgi:hypothetical protein